MQRDILTIFGGSGFIASEIVYKLSKSFKELRLLTRNTQACNHLKVLKNIQNHFLKFQTQKQQALFKLG